MEDLEKHIKFKYNEESAKAQLQSVKQMLDKINGVGNVAEDRDGLTVRYNPYSVSDAYLIREMKQMGFLPLKEAKKKKGIVARWLDKMARANKESFGNQRLDCCELKSKQNKN
ncbi:MAG: hypothetical protein K9I68_07515 [Bacteroidales bacterium]|nr:hypothetical protein [Bacteroidales bacterium]MCF8338347.1 hypothetical protein [Bacteroidales bacterium]